MGYGWLLVILALLTTELNAQNPISKERVKAEAAAISKKVIAWRRDFHQHPELGNREFRTASLIAKHLKSLGLEVQTGVARTGVVALLKGGKPGPVVALRADIDALPIKERVDIPFASKDTGTYEGRTMNVMHACGHDAHTAMLMGAAEILSRMKKDLPGTVRFIFQPAEEGSPAGEDGGAELMIKEGVLANPAVEAIFGIHIMSQVQVGRVEYKAGGLMAGVNDMKITVKGKTAHGGYPWLSVDPIVASAQIINNLQPVISRNLNLTENAGVVTIGAIHGGNRSNIIPEQVEMLGTIRSLSPSDETLLVKRVKEVISKTAESAGASVDIKLPYTTHFPVTFNDSSLTERMLPMLRETAGKENVILRTPVTGGEDFSFYQQKIPGLFVFLGGMPVDGAVTAAPHHTPDFYLDESGFDLGVQLLCNFVFDYAARKGK